MLNGENLRRGIDANHAAVQLISLADRLRFASGPEDQAGNKQTKEQGLRKSPDA